MLAGRDLGAPDAIAEATWAELETTALVGSPTWWDGRLRMLSRTSPEDAAFELLDATALVGRKAITNGHLVLGRWACGDRAAATSFVQTYAPRMRAWGRWTRGLAHDGVLDDAARAGWSDALAAASDPWDAGQLLALAVRLGDLSAVEEVLGRATLSDLERLSYPERSLRLLRLQSPERADATRRTLDAHLPEGLRPGELHDWLTVLTDDRFDLPWWIAYLPGLP
ncbi:MAG TPA: hypothetical protein PKA64_24595 [Myxococcota bacterium]|nr:hypothetical protein [Myxococcota bacterium]